MVQVFADLKAWIDQQIAGILAPINNAASAVKGFFGLGGSDAAAPQARAAGGPVSAGEALSRRRARTRTHHTEPVWICASNGQHGCAFDHHRALQFSKHIRSRCRW